MLSAYPGVCIIETIQPEEKELTFSSESKGKIVRGKVVSVGAPVITDFGARIVCPCVEGNIVYFLKYEGDYDVAYINGRQLVFALFKDIRGVSSE
jgi:co-chaperonin GroES (HSP10)